MVTNAVCAQAFSKVVCTCVF